MDKIEIIGNLGRDPEMQYTPSGQSVTKFSVAVNRRWTSNGERQEQTVWYNVNAWGKQAEACNQYLNRGSQVFVEGRLDARMYQRQDGTMGLSLDVQARDVQFLGGGGQGGDQNQDSNGPPRIRDSNTRIRPLPRDRTAAGGF